MATPNKQTVALVVVSAGVLVLGISLYQTFKSPSVPTVAERSQVVQQQKQAKDTLAQFENANRGVAPKK